MSRSRRATSADVARLAGVSRATVSYVLNSRADQSIPDATRRRVLTAATELKYVPNAASRALAAGESRLVLLVNPGVPWGTNVRTLVDTLTGLVAQTGRSLLMWHRSAPGDLTSVLAHLEPRLVLTLGHLDAEDEAMLNDMGIPLVDAGVDDAASTAEVPSTVQVRYLAAHGHRRIGYVSSSDPARHMFAGPRLDAARSACRALGLEEPLVAELPPGTRLTVGAVADVLAKWRAGPHPVSAVACYNDHYATAVLSAAVTLGLAVPHDLAVIGVDDELFGAYTQPPLTTVRYDMTRFAEHLWARAEHRLDPDATPEAASPIDITLVERESV